MTLLIYGANGYTGELIARRAARKNVPFVLAGRRSEAVNALAQELGQISRVFALDDPQALLVALQGITVVLNCAGPFAQTAQPLVNACLQAHAHYLDITGELTVLAALAARDHEAKTAAITLLPGAGFDVVPSDCLAAEAKHRLPSATHLALAFQIKGGMSRGTAITTIENAHAGGVVRRDGALAPVPSGWRTRTIDFGEGSRKAIMIPWGDLVTAYHSTGIPNIEVYAALPPLQRIGVRFTRFLGPLLASARVQRALIARVRGGAPGPTAEERARGESRLWAEARDDAGHTVELRLRAPEAYALTSFTALELAERALRGELPAGFQTPSRACGRNFILEFPGVTLEPAEGPPEAV